MTITLSFILESIGDSALADCRIESDDATLDETILAQIIAGGVEIILNDIKLGDGRPPKIVLDRGEMIEMGVKAMKDGQVSDLDKFWKGD